MAFTRLTASGTYFKPRGSVGSWTRWNGAGSNYTLSFWTFLFSQTANQSWFGGRDSSPNSGIAFNVDTSGAFYFTHFGTASYTWTAGKIVTLKWQHICVSRTGSSVSLYINGLLDTSKTVGAYKTQNQFGQRIMMYETNGSASAPIDGHMAEFSIHQGIGLSAKQAKVLAGGGSPLRYYRDKVFAYFTMRPRDMKNYGYSNWRIYADPGQHEAFIDFHPNVELPDRYVKPAGPQLVAGGGPGPAAVSPGIFQPVFGYSHSLFP